MSIYGNFTSSLSVPIIRKLRISLWSPRVLTNAPNAPGAPEFENKVTKRSLTFLKFLTLSFLILGSPAFVYAQVPTTTWSLPSDEERSLPIIIFKGFWAGEEEESHDDGARNPFGACRIHVLPCWHIIVHY